MSGEFVEFQQRLVDKRSAIHPAFDWIISA
jgi:hypothetical protein